MYYMYIVVGLQKCWFVVNEIGCSFSMLIGLMFSLVYMSDVLWVGTCASGQTLG